MLIKRLVLIHCIIFLLFLSFCRTQEPAQVLGKYETFFSPGGGIQKALIEELGSARSEIDVAVYIFSSQELAEALISAHRRGVKVRVVLDGSEDEHYFSKGRYLFDNSVYVRVDRSHVIFPSETQGIMHNKFVLIDNSTIITGSYNWTNAAEVMNDENILIIHDAGEVARAYANQFERLWERSIPYDVKELPAPLVISATDLRTLREKAGRKAYVQGRVHKVYFSERSGTYFLNFGPDRSSFTGIIFKSAADEFTKREIDPNDYEEKKIEIYGKIIDHPKYGLEIIIENPVQIRELSEKE
jgi:hypothetical protein